MSTWNAGYRTDIHYTYGYYKELSPTYLKFMLLLKGYDVFNQEDQCHCELGFGQGMSINIHAATHNSHFVGTDFNPSHAAFANYLTQQTHSSTQLYDDSFEQLLARDLPSFDSITLHGIWSWISAENKQYILDFISKFLKPGGVVYISYNTLPGWLALLPVRELFKETYKYATSGQDSIQRTKDAMALTLETLKNSAAFSHMSPKSIEQFENLKTQDLNYVSHEYLNNDWHCVTFSDMQELMQEHKLDFAGKADFSNYTEFLSYTNEQQEYLKTIQSPILKEQSTDFLTNNRFRRDIYVRGGIRLTSAQITYKLDQTRFILNVVAKSHSNKIQGTAGEFNLKEEIYEPIIEFLASEHYRAKSFAEIKKRFPEMSLFVLVQAICILCQKSEVSPCQDEIQINYESAHAFNAFILKNAILEHKLFTLASPLTGQGMQVGYTTLLFLNAIWSEKLTQAKQWAKYAAEIVVNLNLILYDKGRQSLTQYDDVHTELLRLAKEFQQSDWLKVFEAHKLYEVS